MTLTRFPMPSRALRRLLAPRTLLAAASLVLLAACGEQDEPGDPLSPTGPTGRLRFVNAITNATTAQRPVNVRVGDLQLIANLGYGAAVGGTATVPYFPALAQEHSLLVQRTADTTVHVLERTFTVNVNEDQTLIAVRNGPAADAAPTLVLLSDTDNAANASSIRARIVHVAPSQGNVDVYFTPATVTNITTIAPAAPNVAPRTSTAYLTADPGSYTIRVTPAGSKTVLLTINTGALAAGAVRTYLALDAAAGGTPLTSLALVDR